MRVKVLVVVARVLAAVGRVLVRPFLRGATPPAVPPPGAPVRVTVGPTRQVVPGPGLPGGLRVQNANNNLDVIDAGGSRYLAVRTSAHHWASTRTVLVVLRSDDGGATWSLETEVHPGRDAREPRFLVVGDRLLLYYFEAGTNPFRFEPGRILALHRESAGTWTEPRVVSPDDYVVWRTKTVGDVPYMVRYCGGEDAFTRGDAAIDVELMTTDDGYDWRPVDPERPVVHTGGCGETDFALDGDGGLWAVLRNEAGERGVFGSLLAWAPADDLARWDFVDDPRKFDSPLVFSHGGEVWLLGRRQVAFDGRYDLGLRRYGRNVQLLVNQLAYWVTPKRLALWRVNRDERRVEWVVDLPSRGDTAFPGIVWDGPDTLVVYNYSSPPGDDSIPWIAGQIGPTNIYATTVTLPSA